MSLFLRLWIVATLTAFAAAAAAVIAFAVMSGNARLAEEERQAAVLGRIVAHAASMDPLSDLPDEGARALLRERAAELMAAGSLLSVAIVGSDGRAIADLTSPGLEDESALRMAGPLFDSVIRSGMRKTGRRGDVIYAVHPVIDRSARVRGVIGIEMPVHLLHSNDDEVATFAAVAAAIAALLGLFAAMTLTRQVAWPVRRLAELAGRLDDAAYDTSRVAPLIGRRDEIGQLARVMLRLVRALDHLGNRMDEVIERRLRQGAGD